MKKSQGAPDAYDALPRKTPLPYNRTIEAAELAAADDEKYGAPLASLRERMSDASTSLKRGLRRIALGIAIAEHDKKK